ncbi:hypothetical protein IWZ01DRAFT_570134 [Phyllosticta capitalensis]
MSQDWKAKMKYHFRRTNSLREFEDAMRQEIGNDRNKLLEASAWSEAANQEAHKRLNTAYDVKELVEGVDTLNFFRNTSPEYRLWLDKMTHNRRKPIPLGRTAKAMYQLRPDPSGLLPDNESRRRTMRDLNIASRYFLGVNTNIPKPQEIPPPGNSLLATSSPPLNQNPGQQRRVESTETTTSEDDSTGFVFHQIGRLLYTTLPTRPDEYRRLSDFYSTDFYAVARLSSSGRATELWIIQDKFPPDTDGDREDEPDQDLGGSGIGQSQIFNGKASQRQHPLAGKPDT